jgi:hypothetical protein
MGGFIAGTRSRMHDRSPEGPGVEGSMPMRHRPDIPQHPWLVVLRDDG